MPTGPNGDTMETTPISFAEARAAGEKLPAGDIECNYSFNRLTKRDIADSAEHFDPKLAVEALGRLTGGRDPFCGAQVLLKEDGRWVLNDAVIIQWDHLIPVYFLGLTVNGNMCPICKDCNQTKRGDSPFDFQRSLLKEGRAYLSEEAFAEFRHAFSKPYRKGYKKLQKISLNFALSNAPESEIRDAMGLFIDAVVKRETPNGIKMVKAIRVSSKESVRDGSPSAAYFDSIRDDLEKRLSDPSKKVSSSEKTAVLNIQLVTDELYGEGKISSPSPIVSLEAFAMIAQRAFEADLARPSSEGTKTLDTSFGKTKAILNLMAAGSGDREIIDYAAQLSSYKAYLKHGMLKPLVEADLKLIESVPDELKEIGLAATYLRNTLSKERGFQIHLRSELARREATSFVQLPQDEQISIADSFTSGFANEGAKLAGIYSSAVLKRAGAIRA